ncbi:hypothetical protein D3C76_1306760 [compost metagenome]
MERTRVGNCSAMAVGEGPKHTPMMAHNSSCIASRRSRLGAAVTQTNIGYTRRKNARLPANSTGRRPMRSESRPAKGMTRVIRATASICTMNTWSRGRPSWREAKVGIFTNIT